MRTASLPAQTWRRYSGSNRRAASTSFARALRSLAGSFERSAPMGTGANRAAIAFRRMVLGMVVSAVAVSAAVAAATPRASARGAKDAIIVVLTAVLLAGAGAGLRMIPSRAEGCQRSGEPV